MPEVESSTAVAAHRRSSVNVRPVQAAFFQQVKDAAARAAALHSRISKPLLDNDVVAETLLELDSAHEELRVAEEHLQTQAEEIARVQSMLSRERTHYHELFDRAPAPYLLTDRHGNVLEANRRAVEFLNLAGVHLHGKPLAAFMPPEDRTSFRELLSKPMGTDAVSHVEVCLQPRGLPPVHAALSVAPALSHDGTVRSLRWLIHEVATRPDYRERDRARITALEADLTARTRELEGSRCLLDHCVLREQATRTQLENERLKHESVLLSLAQEIRNPLSSISAWLQALHDASLDETARRRILSSMTRGVRGLIRLADNLVDTVQATDAGPRRDLSVSLQGLLQQVLEQSQSAAERRNLQLCAELGDDATMVPADPVKLKQVFENLISNALKFTPAGGTVSVSLSREEDHAQVVISDTGRGISLQRLPNVYEAFGTSHDEHARDGLGLGLHLARRWVRMHHGTITLRSGGKGRGVTVTVRLRRVAKP
jgi:PAS domain S-box-containing protein